MFPLLTIVEYSHMIYPIYVRNWEKGIYLPEPNRTKKPEVTSISECSFLKYYGKHTEQLFLFPNLYSVVFIII